MNSKRINVAENSSIHIVEVFNFFAESYLSIFLFYFLHFYLHKGLRRGKSLLFLFNLQCFPQFPNFAFVYTYLCHVHCIYMYSTSMILFIYLHGMMKFFSVDILSPIVASVYVNPFVSLPRTKLAKRPQLCSYALQF